jgi:hypothetical protein
MNNLTAGTRVTFSTMDGDGATGTIQDRVVVKAYHNGDDAVVYYHVTGQVLLVPACHILLALPGREVQP